MNETLTRTISGAVYIAILVICSLFPISFHILFGIFTAIAVVEFARLVQMPTTSSLLLGGGLYGLFAVSDVSQTLQWTLLGATLFVSFKLLFWLFSTRPTASHTSDKYVNLIGYVILPLILITWLPYVGNEFQPWNFLGICILIWTNDTFAYLSGKAFGKHKLFERISPKKTVEGFLGGWVMSLIFSIPVSLYLVEGSLYQWLIFASLCSIMGTLGDLIESKFKRLAQVKDSGKIMPGHGGILDRLDSIIFVAPFIFLLYQIIQHVS